jgi:inorganic triphosphatase YgiF
MTTEVEARFRADRAAVLSDLVARGRLGRGTLGPARAVEETDRYLDTPNGDFAAARWACRLRAREGRTVVSLKGPALGGGATTEAWLHQRPELEGPATDDLDPSTWPPSDARAFVERVRRDSPLVERFTLRQQRTERGVAVEGSALGTLTLDAVDVEHRGRRIGSLMIVELELHADGPSVAELTELATALGAIDGLTPEPRTKLECALEFIEAG